MNILVTYRKKTYRRRINLSPTFYLSTWWLLWHTLSSPQSEHDQEEEQRSETNGNRRDTRLLVYAVCSEEILWMNQEFYRHQEQSISYLNLKSSTRRDVFIEETKFKSSSRGAPRNRCKIPRRVRSKVGLVQHNQSIGGCQESVSTPLRFDNLGTETTTCEWTGEWLSDRSTQIAIVNHLLWERWHSFTHSSSL